MEAREPKATFAEVAAKFGSGENVIRKFERGETAPRYDDLDSFVAAYAESAEVSVFDLWDEALQRARNSAEAEDPDAEPAARAAQAARIAREATERDRAKSRGKQPPKVKKRRAG